MAQDSGLFKWQLPDFVKGAIVAVLAAVFAVVQTSINSGSLHFDWPVIGKMALAALVAYLAKNLFTNNAGQFATKDIPAG